MVKTVEFREPRYVGDPVNVVNLFNQFEVDEICLLDIGASRNGRGPDLALIKQLADECWVPLAYGGGIDSLEGVRGVLGIGIEKVVLGSAAIESPQLITAAADEFGSQAVVVSVDARSAPDGSYEAFFRNASRPTRESPSNLARRVESLGAGEILLNAVDRDGTMAGFDLELIAGVAAAVSIPVIACGGASSRADLPRPIQAGASAVAAGSLFVYQGRSRGVLINFPERQRVEELFDSP